MDDAAIDALERDGVIADDRRPEARRRGGGADRVQRAADTSPRPPASSPHALGHGAGVSLQHLHAHVRRAGVEVLVDAGDGGAHVAGGHDGVDQPLARPPATSSSVKP